MKGLEKNGTILGLVEGMCVACYCLSYVCWSLNSSGAFEPPVAVCVMLM